MFKNPRIFVLIAVFVVLAVIYKMSVLRQAFDFHVPGIADIILKISQFRFPLSEEEKQAYLLEARTHLNDWNGDTNRLVEAKKLLDRVIESDPAFAPAYLQLARYEMRRAVVTNNYSQTGPLVNAEMNILHSLRLNPDSDHAHILYAGLHNSKKRPDLARKDLEKANSLGTENPWYDLELARVYKLEGNEDEALNIYRKLENEMEDGRALKEAYNGLIKYHKKNRDYLIVDKYYKLIIELDPNDAPMRGYYALYLLLDQGKEDEAIHYAKEALKILDYNEGWIILANALYAKWGTLLIKENKPEEAQKFYEEAYEFFPYLNEVMFQTWKFSKPHPVVQALLSKGISINEKNSEGHSVLVYAAEKGKSDMVKQYLKLGADPNIQGRDGWTPLLIAVKNGYPEIAKVLIENGADINQQRNGKTAAEFAKEKGEREILKMINKAKPKNRTAYLSGIFPALF